MRCLLSSRVELRLPRKQIRGSELKNRGSVQNCTGFARGPVGKNGGTNHEHAPSRPRLPRINDNSVDGTRAFAAIPINVTLAGRALASLSFYLGAFGF
jgi:hypothetical protein